MPNLIQRKIKPFKLKTRTRYMDVEYYNEENVTSLQTLEPHVRIGTDEFTEYEKYVEGLENLLKEVATYQEWQQEKGKPSLYDIQAKAKTILGLID